MHSALDRACGSPAAQTLSVSPHVDSLAHQAQALSPAQARHERYTSQRDAHVLFAAMHDKGSGSLLGTHVGCVGAAGCIVVGPSGVGAAVEEEVLVAAVEVVEAGVSVVEARG